MVQRLFRSLHRWETSIHHHFLMIRCCFIRIQQRLVGCLNGQTRLQFGQIRNELFQLGIPSFVAHQYIGLVRRFLSEQFIFVILYRTYNKIQMAFQFQPFHIAHHVIVHHQSAHSQSQIFRKIGIFRLYGLRSSVDFIAQFHHIFAIKFAKLDGLILLTRCVLKGHSHGFWHDRTVFMLVGVDSSWGFKVPHNCILIIHKRQKHGIDTRHIKIRWIKIHTHWLGAVPFDEGLVVIQPIPRSVIDLCEPTFCGILDARQKFLFITDGLFPKNLIRNFRCFDQMRDALALRFR